MIWVWYNIEKNIIKFIKAPFVKKPLFRLFTIMYLSVLYLFAIKLLVQLCSSSRKTAYLFLVIVFL